MARLSPNRKRPKGIQGSKKELVVNGPISRILCGACPKARTAAIIPLGRRSLGGSSGLPEGSNGPGRPSPPIWPCTARGLPCRRHCCRRGGLLPHRFTLTRRCGCGRPDEGFAFGMVTDAADAGGFVSVALSVAEPFPVQPPGVTRRAALWSPDFPPGFVLRQAQRSPGPLTTSSIPHPVRRFFV